jgi:hypothetical protein
MDRDAMGLTTSTTWRSAFVERGMLQRTSTNVSRRFKYNATFITIDKKDTAISF